MTETNFASATITNDGTGTIQVTNVVTSGPGFELEYPLPFELPFSLVPDASVEVPMLFTPQAAGEHTGLLIVTSTASGSPHSIGLIGVGEAAEPYPPEPGGSSVTYVMTANFASGASATPTMPAGEAGDLLVAVLAGGGVSSEFSTPAGWTMQHQYVEHDQQLAFFYKIRGASETPPTFTRPTGTNGFVWSVTNFHATGRTMPTQVDDSSHNSITSAHASYIGTGITTTVRDTLVLMITVGSLYDTINPTGPGAPDSPGMGSLGGSSGTFPATLSGTAWEQTLGASQGTPYPVPYICRMLAVLWSGVGPTSQVAYVSPGGSTLSTTFMVAFRVPGP